MATITSILDTDLYKLTMQNAVYRCYPSVQATYKFTNRTKSMTFTRKCYEDLCKSVDKLANLSLTQEERDWLTTECSFLDPDYLDYLQAYRFQPSQVAITFHPDSPDLDKGQIEMLATGLWLETILWEIPLMALLSETYFLTVDTEWTYDGQEEKAFQKGKRLLEENCVFSEFGTRRRRSFKTHDTVVAGLVRASKEVVSKEGKLIGTSNVHLAQKYNLTPIGTIAHEWFMGTAALRTYKNSSLTALDLWESVYPPPPSSAHPLHISLTDTFTTPTFLAEFTTRPELVKRWRIRQDSGDPLAFVKLAKDMYERVGLVNAQGKVEGKSIIFSDSLNVEKAVEITKACNGAGLQASFGIGTFFTNDFLKSDGGGEKSKALNIVIKLASVDSLPCVKLSDDVGKHTGVPEAVAHVMKELGIHKP